MKRIVWLTVLLILLSPLAALAQSDQAAKPGEGGVSAVGDKSQVAAYVALAIALVTGLSIIGAGYAVGHIGSAAIGVASEQPEMLGRSLIFVALGEGLAVLGLAVAFMLLFMVLLPMVQK
jgi:V/A-type H+-transporting ATPase subunit K